MATSAVAEIELPAYRILFNERSQRRLSGLDSSIVTRFVTRNGIRD